jgi:hypothetical protein
MGSEPSSAPQNNSAQIAVWDRRDRPIADEVGGTCSTGIECAKVQLL